MAKPVITVAPKQIGGENKRRGLKIMTILHSTLDSAEFNTRFDNVIRDSVRVRFIGRTKGTGDEVRYNYTTTESKQHTESPTHKQAVVRLQPQLPWSQSRVAARCDCSDWKFRCEYVWAKRGAALEPRQADDEPPIKTNPKQTVFACKHLITIFNRLLKNG